MDWEIVEQRLLNLLSSGKHSELQRKTAADIPYSSQGYISGCFCVHVSGAETDSGRIYRGQ